MSNKTINSDSVYVGKLVKLSLIERNEDTNSKEKYIATNYEPYRSIIFTIDKDGLCNDLIYDSPKYAILNHTNDDVYWSMLLKENKHWNIEPKTVIIDSICIGPLLQKFNYNKELTNDDINNIRKNMFNNKFLDENSFTFGYYEYRVPHYTSVSVIGEPRFRKPTYIKNKIRYALFRNFKGKIYRIGPIKNYVEMNEYWNAIETFGSDNISDFLKKGFNVRLNSFKPSKKEGKIKIKTVLNKF